MLIAELVVQLGPPPIVPLPVRLTQQPVDVLAPGVQVIEEADPLCQMV